MCERVRDGSSACAINGSTAIVQFFSYNGSGSTAAFNITAYGDPSHDTGIAQTLTVDPIPSLPPDPDGPCPGGCGGQAGGQAAKPISLTNGDTWISQQDYQMPGIAGGFALTRTWNSLWATMGGPEEVGIFGDSWRSNLEERIQVLLSYGLVKYWRGNGNSLIYSSNNGSYTLVAPINEQITLTYNSTSQGWTIAEKNGTQRIFNSAGYLTSIVDRNGNTTTINVDANNQNRISSVTDPSGHVVTFNYADANNPRLCTSISDSVGTFTQYQYDNATQRLLSVTYPDGSQDNFQYNDSNSDTLISLVTDSQGRTLEGHTYDSSRRGITAFDANDSTGSPVNKVTVTYGFQEPWINYICDSNGNQNCTSVYVTSFGQRRYIYKTGTTGNGNACNTCTFPATSQSMFDNNGYPASSDTGGSAYTTLYQYDSSGNMLTKTLPTGDYNGQSGIAVWNYTYNFYGQTLSATDPLGSTPGDPNHTTTWTYDANGNLTSVTTPSPDGSTQPSITTYTNNAQGQVTQVVDPLNNATTIVYCTQGQTNCPYGLIYYIQDAQNNKTTYAYDGRGNRTSATDAAGNVTSFQYDSMNRVILITYPTSPATTVQNHYDWRGRRDYVVDQNGNKASYAYDDADRLITVTDAQSPTHGVTTYGYDTENDLTDIWDANNNHTQFLYYPGQSLYQINFPSGYSESYDYLLNGLLYKKTDRNGRTIYYYYDPQNQLSEKVTPDGNVVFYTFDAAERVTDVNDNNGDYEFAYDNMNRLTSTSVDYFFNSIGRKTMQYGYDAASNRVSMTDPQGTTTTYGYDTLNRLTSLGNSWAGSFSFGYDALSRRTSLTRPNGVNTSYSYDSLSRLLSVLHQSGSTTLDGAAYTYDAAGNRLSKTNYLNGVTSNYGYDNIYQLLQVTQGSSTTESYSYDLVGNRLSSLSVSPYQHNSSNELTSTPVGNYTYDKNGNTLTDAQGRSYTWDPENRLTKVVNPGVGTTTFLYDPFGRRIQKSGPLGTTNYLYDGVAAWADVIEELDNNGNALAKYAQQHLETDQPLSELRSGTASYFLQDGLGSVTSLSNSAGALTNTYAYDSFGQRTASTGTLTNPFQYTGRDFDSETNLYYYRARYYDTTMGRFLNEDPIGFKGGIDFYAYVKNNPITSSDPTGQAASGGAGTEACDYYDKRCKAPCVVPKDSYACKAGQCCRDFGTGPKQNCVRQCLIEHDRQCIQQHGNSLPSCRFYNHVVCYTSCGFIPSSVSQSCLKIALGQ